MLKPLRVCSGDKVAVVAPASGFPREEFDKGVAELRRLGFGYAQGYYFARPQNPQRVRQLLRSAAASQPRREPLGHAPELAPLVTPTLGET